MTFFIYLPFRWYIPGIYHAIFLRFIPGILFKFQLKLCGPPGTAPGPAAELRLKCSRTQVLDHTGTLPPSRPMPFVAPASAPALASVWVWTRSGWCLLSGQGAGPLVPCIRPQYSGKLVRRETEKPARLHPGSGPTRDLGWGTTPLLRHGPSNTGRADSDGGAETAKLELAVGAESGHGMAQAMAPRRELQGRFGGCAPLCLRGASDGRLRSRSVPEASPNRLRTAPGASEALLKGLRRDSEGPPERPPKRRRSASEAPPKRLLGAHTHLGAAVPGLGIDCEAVAAGRDHPSRAGPGRPGPAFPPPPPLPPWPSVAQRPLARARADATAQPRNGPPGPGRAGPGGPGTSCGEGGLAAGPGRRRRTRSGG